MASGAPQPLWQDELAALRALSARIGADPLLTQAAGGNTSLKDGDTLWIKASGTWLAHALDRDIFVPVDMPPLLKAVANAKPEAEQAHLFTVDERNSSGLRPSIETTVHALLPQRVVVHVHCVDTIAMAVRKDAQALLADVLEGLNWAFVPYRRPGLPLALAIAEHSDQRPDVLLLANHGLVVAAETVEGAAALLDRVKGLVATEPRMPAHGDETRLRAIAGQDYRLPAFVESHAAATDPVSTAHAAGGSLYPDHVIFLGVGSVVALPGESADDVVRRCGFAPLSVLFPGHGVLMRADANAGAEAMARCLADVLARVPAGAPVNYLTSEENRVLTDWDAEKYRQRLNAAAASGAA